jgi:hypothetical protein
LIVIAAIAVMTDRSRHHDLRIPCLAMIASGVVTLAVVAWRWRKTAPLREARQRHATGSRTGR